MKTKLTETLVKNLPLNSVVWDAEITGLGIRRQRRDRVFILRRHGQQSVIGEWPVLSVADARHAAIDRLRGNKALGGGSRFKDVVDRYLAAGQWRPRSRVEIERHLVEDARPFAERRLAEIDRLAIANLLNEVERRGSIARNRVRSNLSALFNFAIAEGLTEQNPVKGTRQVPEQSRSRVLSRDEIAVLWRGLPATEYGSIVRLLLLTGQRRSEIANLQRSEIVLGDSPAIVLPAERTKANREHSIPLAPQALAILTPYLDASDAVFNFVSFSDAKAVLDAKLGIAHFTLHDCRRTCATGMAEWLNVPPHIISAVLNHAKQGVAGVYNRAIYAREMRSALTRWADYVEAL
jgi:integrase